MLEQLKQRADGAEGRLRAVERELASLQDVLASERAQRRQLQHALKDREDQIALIAREARHPSGLNRALPAALCTPVFFPVLQLAAARAQPGPALPPNTAPQLGAAPRAAAAGPAAAAAGSALGGSGGSFSFGSQSYQLASGVGAPLVPTMAAGGPLDPASPPRIGGFGRSSLAPIHQGAAAGPHSNGSTPREPHGNHQQQQQGKRAVLQASTADRSLPAMDLQSRIQVRPRLHPPAWGEFRSGGDEACVHGRPREIMLLRKTLAGADQHQQRQFCNRVRALLPGAPDREWKRPGQDGDQRLLGRHYPERHPAVLQGQAGAGHVSGADGQRQASQVRRRRRPSGLLLARPYTGVCRVLHIR